MIKGVDICITYFFLVGEGFLVLREESFSKVDREKKEDK